MRVWRIATDTPDFVADDLAGTGARLTGGRWNRPGQPVLYCAASPALACLETLVHLGTGSLPMNRYLVAIDIPDASLGGAGSGDARLPASGVGCRTHGQGQS